MSGIVPATSPFDAIKHTDERGDHWTARKLAPLLEYAQWRNFEDRALSARNAIDLAMGDGAGRDHIADLSSMVPIGSGATRKVDDFRLTRFGAYMTALECDGSKQAVADAKAYFAIRTEQAERAEAAVPVLGDPLAELERQTAMTARAIEIAKAERAGREVAEQRAAALEGPAAAWDEIAAAEGDFSLREAAFMLRRAGIDTGQNRLMKSLRDLGMVDRRGVPYARHEDHLHERPLPWEHPHTGEPRLGTQIRVTARGLEYIRRRLLGAAHHQLDIPGQ